jgi:hypothetical protein
MAARGVSFPAIPTIPQQGLDTWHYQTLNAMRDTLEMLTGARGPAAAAALKSDVRVTALAPLNATRVSASGAGHMLNGVAVADRDDYVRLILDVQRLMNDVSQLHAVLGVLVSQLRG